MHLVLTNDGNLYFINNKMFLSTSNCTQYSSIIIYMEHNQFHEWPNKLSILIKQRGICLRVCPEWLAMPCMEWLPALGIQG